LHHCHVCISGEPWKFRVLQNPVAIARLKFLDHCAVCDCGSLICVLLFVQTRQPHQAPTLLLRTAETMAFFPCITIFEQLAMMDHVLLFVVMVHLDCILFFTSNSMDCVPTFEIRAVLFRGRAATHMIITGIFFLSFALRRARSACASSAPACACPGAS